MSVKWGELFDLCWSGQNWNKNIWFLHHLKALSEWAHFLKLAWWFWRYLNFSAPKKRDLLDKPTLEGSYNLNGIKKKIFEGFFAIFRE